MRPFDPVVGVVAALLAAGCSAPPVSVPELQALEQVNAAVNRVARSCKSDYCLERWPTAAELASLERWDCKAYAVAKADRLMRDYGYSPDRLEYVLISGPPLRVTHAALLVDGRWVLDQGVRCQVCDLERFSAGVSLVGRLPVEDLRWVVEAQRR